MVIGASPWATFGVILTGPLQDVFGITEILVRAVPLILVALGVAISFRSGILNIGAEGQILVGILCATAVALRLPQLPRVVLLPLCLAAGAAGGAVWGGIAGVLRARLDVNEILSTVMLNYIAAQLYTFMLRGPMIDPAELMTGSGTPQSMRLTRAVWLDRLDPRDSAPHRARPRARRWRSWCGCSCGGPRSATGCARRAPAARRRATPGFHVERALVVAMLFAGGFAGLAGAIEVLGVHHRAIEAISSGYGFAAIVVALFGGLHPLGIVPSAAFFGLLLVGADMTQRSAGVPANMILVLQGAIILAIVSAKMYLNNPYAKQRAAKLLGRLGASRARSSTGEAGT